MLTDNDPMLARRYGKWLMVGAGICTVLYTLGLIRRSYLALAAPVTILVGAALATVGLLGQLLSTTPDEPPDPS